MSTPSHDDTAEPHGPHRGFVPGPGHRPAQDSTAEGQVRRALHEAALTVEPSPWPGAAVKQRSARRRRARRLAATLPVVAAVAACAVVMAAMSHDRAPAPTLPAASTSPPTPDRSPAVGAPVVRVVPPGRPFAVGDGERMKLEPARRCLSRDSEVWQCDTAVASSHPAGSVSSQNRADQDGTVYAPLYIGPGLPARMTVTVQGRTYPVQMVTLPGHPGYASGYVVGPPPPSPGHFPELAVQVYDARGTVMASLVSPGSASSSSASNS